MINVQILHDLKKGNIDHWIWEKEHVTECKEYCKKAQCKSR